MDYSPEFSKKLRKFQSEDYLFGLLRGILARSKDFFIARTASHKAVADSISEIRQNLKDVKIINVNVGNLLGKMHTGIFDDLSCSNFRKKSDKRVQQIPDVIWNLIEAHGDALFKDKKGAIYEKLEVYKTLFSEDIAYLDDLLPVYGLHKQEISDVWVMVFDDDTDRLHNLQPWVQDYLFKVNIFDENLPDELSSRKWSHDYTDQSKDPEKKENSYGYGSKSSDGYSNSYSARAKSSVEEKGTASPKRWGDYTSSDEEDEDLSSMMHAFGQTHVSSKPTIDIPKDFEEYFPEVFKAWRKVIKKWGWTINPIDCLISKEGFTGSDFGKANDERRGEILSALSNEKRINLNTFCAFLVSVLWQPDSISEEEQTAKLVSGYVTSLFLKKKFGKNDSDLKLLKTSLKGNDAGESVIKFRISSCFLTGSKCAQTLMKSVAKMLQKIVATSSEEIVNSVLLRSDLCFTSPQGMMENSFRTVQKRTVEVSETSNNRGKRKKTRVSVMKPGKDRPHLNARSLELSQKEYELVRAKENSFNKLDELIFDILNKFKTSRDPLKTAKVVKEVTDLAYDKISGIRRINKARRNAIRARAQEASSEKNLTSSDWTKAKKELFPSFEEIGTDILMSLEWNPESIVESLKSVIIS